VGLLDCSKQTVVALFERCKRNLNGSGYTRLNLLI